MSIYLCSHHQKTKCDLCWNVFHCVGQCILYVVCKLITWLEFDGQDVTMRFMEKPPRVLKCRINVNCLWCNVFPFFVLQQCIFSFYCWSKNSMQGVSKMYKLHFAGTGSSDIEKIFCIFSQITNCVFLC